MGILSTLFGRDEPMSLDDLEELPGSVRNPFSLDDLEELPGSIRRPFELPPLPGEPGSPQNPFTLDTPEEEDALQREADWRNQDFIPVSSSTIQSAAYSKVHSFLWIWFHTGSLYVYCDVPESTFESLISVGSPGNYHRYAIRCVYRYSLLVGSHELDKDCYASTEGCSNPYFPIDIRA